MSSRRYLAALFAAEAVTLGMGDRKRMDVWLDILNSYKGILTDQMRRAGGKVVGRSPTALIVEFSTIVRALECARTVQRAIAVRNEALPAENQVHFRFGLHVGEVVVDDERISGYGADIAMLLSAAAEPGTIRISGQAYDLVGKRREGFERFDDMPVHGLTEPVRVYGTGAPSVAVEVKATHGGQPRPAPRQVPQPDETEDVTILDLSSGFAPPQEPVPTGTDTTGADDATDSTQIAIPGDPLAGLRSRVRELESQVAENAGHEHFYQALQVYDEAISAALGLEGEAGFLEELQDRSSRLEQALGFRGDAVFELPSGRAVLRVGQAFSIGRDSDCVRIGCKLVSRAAKQNIISYEDGEFWLIDAGSSNGTLMADGKLLEPGQKVRVSNDHGRMVFYLGGGRGTGEAGPCMLSIQSLGSVAPALVLEVGPTPGADLNLLKDVWPTMADDTGSVYVLSTGPILLGEGDECAIRVEGDDAGVLARIDYNDGYEIEPLNQAKLQVDQVAFSRRVKLADGANVTLNKHRFVVRSREAGADGSVGAVG